MRFGRGRALRDNVCLWREGPWGSARFYLFVVSGCGCRSLHLGTTGAMRSKTAAVGDNVGSDLFTNEIQLTNLERMRALANQAGCVFRGYQPKYTPGSARGPWWMLDVPDCNYTTITVPIGHEDETAAIVAAKRAEFVRIPEEKRVA